MKRFGLLIMACGIMFSFATGSFGEGDPAKAKMIKGNISKLDCGKATIVLTNVRNLRKSTEKLPDITLTLNEGTKLTNAKKCEELQEGNLIFVTYKEGNQGNVATDVMLTKQREFEEKLRERGVRNKETLQKQAQEQLNREEILKKRLEQRSAVKGELEQNEAKDGQSIEKNQD